MTPLWLLLSSTSGRRSSQWARNTVTNWPSFRVNGAFEQSTLFSSLSRRKLSSTASDQGPIRWGKEFFSRLGFHLNWRGSLEPTGTLRASSGNTWILVKPEERLYQLACYWTLICSTPAKISLTKNFKVNLTSKVRVNLKKLSNWRNFPFCVSPSDSFHSHDFEVLKSFGVTPGFGDPLKWLLLEDLESSSERIATFLLFICERHMIWQRKCQGEDKLMSNPVMEKKWFTNVYRELDRRTQ